MKVLLDTHVLLWWLNADKRLSASGGALISDPENTIFVSAVSHWEIWLKQSLGKLGLPPAFANRLEDEGFEALPLTAEHTRAIAALPWHHRDPFDRMLVTQAQTARLELLTSDPALAAYGGFVRVCQPR